MVPLPPRLRRPSSRPLLYASNAVDLPLEGILTIEQPLDAALATNKVAVPVQLHVARRHRDGPTAWRPRTALDLQA